MGPAVSFGLGAGFFFAVLVVFGAAGATGFFAVAGVLAPFMPIRSLKRPTLSAYACAQLYCSSAA